MGIDLLTVMAALPPEVRPDWDASRSYIELLDYQFLGVELDDFLLDPVPAEEQQAETARIRALLRSHVELLDRALRSPDPASSGLAVIDVAGWLVLASATVDMLVDVDYDNGFGALMNCGSSGVLAAAGFTLWSEYADEPFPLRSGPGLPRSGWLPRVHRDGELDWLRWVPHQLDAEAAGARAAQAGLAEEWAAITGARGGLHGYDVGDYELWLLPVVDDMYGTAAPFAELKEHGVLRREQA